MEAILAWTILITQDELQRAVRKETHTFGELLSDARMLPPGYAPPSGGNEVRWLVDEIEERRPRARAPSPPAAQQQQQPGAVPSAAPLAALAAQPLLQRPRQRPQASKVSMEVRLRRYFERLSLADAEPELAQRARA